MIHAYINIWMIYCRQERESERGNREENERVREILCSPKPDKSGSIEESPMITQRVMTLGL